jgi:DNA repair exonuclease SbcCD ATPase subunit
MLDLEKIEFQNFLSYGNYKTEIKLAKQGECFIFGEIVEADVPEESSNGAGKSSAMQSILWCLSGQTMHSKKPGSNIKNYYSEDPTKAKITLKDGRTITRIRDGKNTELFYTKDGIDVISGTLSTTNNMQKQLDKELNMDWDIFQGSVFCSQYNKPWLEMSDTARKQTLERITGVDRFTFYAKTTKVKLDNIEKGIELHTREKELLVESVSELEEALSESKEANKEFQEALNTRYEKKLKEAKEEALQLKSLETINIEKLEKKWELIAKIQEKLETIQSKNKSTESQIETLREEKQTALDNLRKEHEDDLKEKKKDHKETIDTIEEEINEHQPILDQLYKDCTKAETQVESTQSKIDQWEKSEGTTCTKCEQKIPHDHTAGKIEPLQKKLDDANTYLNELKETLTTLNQEQTDRHALIKERKSGYESGLRMVEIHYGDVKEETENEYDEKIKNLKKKLFANEAAISQIEEKIESNTPRVTIEQATTHNQSKVKIEKRIIKIEKEAEEILEEQNPHDKIISSTKTKIENKNNRIEGREKKLKNLNIVFKHLKYIHKSYTDRTKIKKYAIGRHIPYFNTRLHFYTDIFDLDIKIGITDSFGITTNLWGYEYMSGGERGRYNAAFMLAVMDLHEAIHGKQSNILVLDEVDSELDRHGTNQLIHIIGDYLSSKFESIFIISHNSSMRNMFPSQLRVVRTGRLSQIVQQ